MSKIEMYIDSLRVSLMNYQRTLILKEKEGKRVLAMFISAEGADAISMELKKIPPPAHLTHDFICSIITRLGATLKYVIIDRLSQETFYAKAVMERESEPIEIDSRPSDAIAIALRAGVPIYVTEEILSKGGVTIDTANGNT